MRKCSGDFHKDGVFLLLPCNCPQCSLIELSHSFHWELLPNYTLRYVASTLHIDTVYIRKKRSYITCCRVHFYWTKDNCSESTDDSQLSLAYKPFHTEELGLLKWNNTSFGSCLTFDDCQWHVHTNSAQCQTTRQTWCKSVSDGFKSFKQRDLAQDLVTFKYQAILCVMKVKRLSRKKCAAVFQKSQI